MYGRVLEEALEGAPSEVAWTVEIHEAEYDMGVKTYKQQIKISTVGTTSYVDEGNSVG